MKDDLIELIVDNFKTEKKLRKFEFEGYIQHNHIDKIFVKSKENFLGGKTISKEIVTLKIFCDKFPELSQDKEKKYKIILEELPND